MAMWWVIGGVVLLLVAFKLKMSFRSPGALEAMQTALDKGAPLIDVRSKFEFKLGHLARAVNIPVEELRSSLKQVGSKSKPVVVYCASGARSSSAVRVLKSAGYATVYDLGPMTNGRRLGR